MEDIKKETFGKELAKTSNRKTVYLQDLYGSSQGTKVLSNARSLGDASSWYHGDGAPCSYNTPKKLKVVL